MASEAVSRFSGLPIGRRGPAAGRGPGIVLAVGAVAAAVTLAALAPTLFFLASAWLGLGMLVLLAFRHNAGAGALWLLLTACTLEFSLGDLLGPTSYQPIIAVVKATGLLLAGLAVLRFGPRADAFNPAFGFIAMFFGGWAHGLHPGLMVAASLRSLAGSAAPFAFSFSRLSAGWARAIIGATGWSAVVSVAAGSVLAVAGVRPLFVDSGGARLAALGIPAFLGGLALAGIYACLIELYRRGESRHALLMAANFVILVLTGARAALLCGGIVVALTLAFVPSPRVSRAGRLLMLLGAAVAVPLLVGMAESLSALRLFNVLAHDAGNLSGRDQLWPAFERAASESPWFGWGVGAGNTIIPRASDIALIMHTWAAHDEYLRIAVEGGQLGRALLIGLFALWCVYHSRYLCRTNRCIMRLVFVAIACHALLDNVLIYTPASVLFAFVSAVFARGRLEFEARRR